MKRLQIKEQRIKEVRQIDKKQKEIWKQIRNLGLKKLDKPYRHGWYKEIVITPKVERYKSEKAILEIYQKIEKAYWGRTKAEAQKKWDDQTSKDLIYRNFPTLSKRQFSRLSPKAQSLCTSYRYKNERKKWKIRFYIRIPKDAYKIKFTRAYVTHCKRIDPTLESQYEQLDQLFYRKGYYKTMRKNTIITGKTNGQHPN